ncbi:MAG: hypothetical protein H7231_12580 [Rhodoferax sp.]|nr:hypothetical protein [Actinomycetota bacterium]
MFETISTSTPTDAAASLRVRVAGLGVELGGWDARGVPDVELVGLLGGLEVL